MKKRYFYINEINYRQENIKNFSTTLITLHYLILVTINCYVPQTVRSWNLERGNYLNKNLVMVSLTLTMLESSHSLQSLYTDKNQAHNYWSSWYCWVIPNLSNHQYVSVFFGNGYMAFEVSQRVSCVKMHNGKQNGHCFTEYCMDEKYFS